jgi:hypothetical protein
VVSARGFLQRHLGLATSAALLLAGCLGSAPGLLSGDAGPDVTTVTPDAMTEGGGDEAGTNDEGGTGEGGVVPTTCVDGGPCAPSDCQLGTVSCTSNDTPSCATTQMRMNGTPCDAGADASGVCSSGACGSCSTGADCTDPNSCAQKNIVCATGGPVCTAMGNVANGKPCGTNLFCNNGTCQACTAGASCVPMGKPCNNGIVSCSAGQVVCTDQGTPATDGTSCGVNQVCKSGGCVACTANVVCTPPSALCHTGLTSCSTGASVCVDKGAGQNGVACMSTNACFQSYSCQGGTCTGASPVTCTALDSCHQVGTCNMGTGACSNPNQTDGTGCGTGKTCTSGVCGCASGLSSCNSNCVNYQTDAANCGSCGHSCIGGTCTGGKCDPWAVITGQTLSPLSTNVPLAADANYVAFSHPGVGIYEIPVAGEQNSKTATLLSSANPGGLTVANGKIVWVQNDSTGGGTTLYFVNEGGTMAQVSHATNESFTGGNGWALGVTPNGSAAYVIDSGGVNNCSPITTAASCGSLGSLSVTSGYSSFLFTSNTTGYVFLGSGSSVVSMALPSGTKGSGTGTNILDVTSDSTNVYWLNTTSPTTPSLSISRAAIATIGTSSNVVSNVAAGTVYVALGSIASDGTNVYLATVNPSGGSAGASFIASVPKGGGSLSAHLYDTGRVIVNMISMGGVLYWAEVVDNDANSNLSIMGWRYP